jgi:hypothetical protein
MASIFDWKKVQGIKYQKKILLGIKGIFEPPNGNKNLHETINDNGVKVVIFAKICINIDSFRWYATCSTCHL